MSFSSSSSTRYPRNMLHGLVEPQWFPRPVEDTGSRLDDLEKEEDAYTEALYKQVIPQAPLPIGLAATSTGTPGGPDGTTTTTVHNSTTSSTIDYPRTLPPPVEVDLRALPVQPTFWEQHRLQVQETLNQQRASSLGEEHPFASSSIRNDRDNQPMARRTDN